MELKWVGSALACSFAALTVFGASPVSAQEDLAVMSFGGAYQQAWRTAVFEPYTEKTGIKIIEQE